ncbi:hypothetical protein BOX15_Mlig005151g2, partial [Macrostomum lignano]
ATDTKMALVLDKLRESVLSGNPIELHTLLSDHRELYLAHRDQLTQGRPGFDPLYLAMHYGEEDCAALLLDFGFPHNRDYDGSSVESLARDANYQRFSRAMELRRSGDTEKFRQLIDNLLQTCREEKLSSLHEQAKQAIYENALSDKAGNTLLHLCAASQDLQALVTAYTLALMGINVNTQNKSGETALHVAARRGQAEMCRALLLCGADPLLRDRLGQLPVDCAPAEAADSLAAIFNRYSPGLAEALRRGSYKAGVRALDLWVSPHSQLLPGHTALDFYSGHPSSTGAPDCPALAAAIDRESPFLDLVHNILADNTEGAKLLLRKLPPKKLHLDRRHPETQHSPLSLAVGNRNLALTRALLSAGASPLGLRPNGEPLANYAITSACQFDLLMMLVEAGVDSEARDPDGFTMLHRLIRTDIRPQHFVRVLQARQGQNVLLLKDRLPFSCELRTPREMAVRLGRRDLAEAMDSVIDELFRQSKSRPAKGLLMTLATNFYGAANFGPTSGSKDPVKEQFLSRIQLVEKSCGELFEAIRQDDLEKMKALNEVDYRDVNGYSALIRAVACNRYEMALWILAERPQQAAMADNEGLTPLHYAYLLPDLEGNAYIQLLTRSSPVVIPLADQLETLADMRGFVPCQLRERREHQLFRQALDRARSLDVYGRK